MLHRLCRELLKPKKEVPRTLGMTGLKASHALLSVLFLFRLHWPVSTSTVLVVSSFFYVAISTSVCVN